ncbi:hypothetical protein [Companilactobacillus paralimentarius]|uniref:hypothetical protein n=1 Tax=Companilactobacillus paralimentarius TaxID=83526 RepID=UPI00186B7AA0|nr:hypothetical protein [Companilactobacillus paralimentarius]
MDSEKAENRADNRIASGFAHFITAIKTGYRFGNDINFSIMMILKHLKLTKIISKI